MSRVAQIVSRHISLSTYRRLRAALSSSSDLVRHIKKHTLQNGRLRNHCRGKSGLLINIGCGPLTADGWVNLDINPGDGAFYYDALDPLPIADGAVRHIHCEHFLEHVAFDDARCFLRDCYRVLQQGGSMRIIVPDAEKYMRAYVANDQAFFSKMSDIGHPVEPLHPKNMVCNQSFRMGGHHLFGWDYETLEHVASQIGFSVRLSSQFDVDDQFCIDGTDDWRPVESLYANLRKN